METCIRINDPVAALRLATTSTETLQSLGCPARLAARA